MYRELEKNMSFFGGNVNDAALILCTQGCATIKINLKDYDVKAGSEIVLLPDCICALMAFSEDFKLVQFTMDENLFFQATRSIDPDFFGRLKAFPVFHHTDKTLPSSLHTLALLKEYSEDPDMKYSYECIILILRSLMLKIYDYISKELERKPQIPKSQRPAQICEHFIRLVIHHCSRERKVSWYASRLCISSRYLAQACSQTIGSSPKEIIDNYAVQEISLLLSHSELSIQQIADKMHFPDQSTLGRYFKQHSSVSPYAYRIGARPADIHLPDEK
ncbi:MAG: helix-turn-helix domain-containing protein [Candidatus Cryptobacteroides sp.]